MPETGTMERSVTSTAEPGAGSTSAPPRVKETSTARASTGSPSRRADEASSAARACPGVAEATDGTVPSGRAPSGAWTETIAPLVADPTQSRAGRESS